MCKYWEWLAIAATRVVRGESGTEIAKLPKRGNLDKATLDVGELDVLFGCQFHKNLKWEEVKTMKKAFVLVAVMLFVVASVTAASAFSFRVPSYSGPVLMKYSNWEQATPGTEVGVPNGVVDQVGEQLDGILKVTTIHAIDASRTLLWSDGDNGEELTGHFWGYTAALITPTGPKSADVDFTGGNVDIYLDNTPDFLATWPGVGVMDGSLFLSCAGTPGIVPATPYTLHSSLNALTSPFTGDGAGYLDIVGGSHASLFVANYYGPGRDLLTQSDLEAPGTDGWPISSEDPVKGGVVPVPPSILLLGSGCVGMVGFARRRFTK